MLAIVVHQPGGPEALSLEERPIPRPAPGWVLVKIRAFGLNRSELVTRAGGSGDAAKACAVASAAARHAAVARVGRIGQMSFLTV